MPGHRLSAADFERAKSWLPEIAEALLPAGRSRGRVGATSDKAAYSSICEAAPGGPSRSARPRLR